MASYKVFYAQSVVDFMLSEITSERVYNRIDNYRDVLSMFPDIGAVYDPQYDAAAPPFECRFVPVPDTPFTIYYRKNELERTVEVFDIEFQRSNPLTRF